ncbi:hypothetical protein M3P05_14995 [Sansalvadorimonas sp. 2012CJ34-2]|uniref:Metallophosphoesterase n=1 Tax=Parendozoicomonas callyspongiae TaxID=2942213 RepID=A0ABT0PJ20_9GAMM|nr:hypothetical protein [Sansalvadorimonas sp. 2012CJ34-2]MCL6271231.1 hypothetical protein [Sansalvadorimonas sp. 2012CJ34-2]
MTQDAQEDLAAFWQELQLEEKTLVQFFSSKGCDTSFDLPESGLSLYILNSLPSNTVATMQNILGMPRTTLDDQAVDKLLEGIPFSGWVGKDGSLFTFTKYAQFDPGWTTSLFYYIAVKTGLIKKAEMPPHQPIDLSLWDKFTVIMNGDWGTGYWQDGAKDCPAKQVMASIQRHRADIAVHLGDEYYAGTNTTVAGAPGEEATHFSDLWDPRTQYSFALGSNHGMYDGENGLVHQTLASPTFAAQGGTSIFVIKTRYWNIVGLDSARDNPSTLFEVGYIGQNQITLLQQVGADGKKVMILTHHNALSLDGKERMPIWSQVVKALGRDPDYWVWGHKHIGTAYSSFSAAGNTKAFCFGHGAIPVGVASQLLQADGSFIPQVTYYAHTPLPDPDIAQEKRVMNGYALFDFNGDSVMVQMYNQLGQLEWNSGTAGNAAGKQINLEELGQ